MKSNWERVHIGDVCKLEYGKPLIPESRNLNGLYPVYGANGEKTRSNVFLYSKPSIVIGRKGSAGELHLVYEKFWPLDVTYYTTHEKCKYDIKFLYYLLSNQNLTSLAKGVKPGINRNDIYNIEVKIPPLHTQKQIAEKLDTAFSEIQKLHLAQLNKLKSLNNLKKSLLTQAFNGELTKTF